MQPGGLYIHVPFCHAKCFYCDFYSLSATEELMDAYTDAVVQEWRMRCTELPADPVTVYLGGGTPSSIGTQRLGRILREIPLATASEITIEANPEDVTVEWAREVVAMGVNRVSMGVQSLVDSELRAIGRRHNAVGALAAVAALRAAGVSNISLDLIYGLPGQTLESWQRSLDELLELRPEHLSAYALAYEEGTRLTSMLRRGIIKPAADEDVVEMYSLLCTKASEAGYEHYEISNFALPGFRARHNSSYWSMVPYLGIGPAAHSFDGTNTRRANPGSLRRWLAAIGEGCTACDIEREDSSTLTNDRVMTALRTAEGIPATSDALCEAAPFLSDGRMTTFTDTHGERRLRITEGAWIASDPIMAQFMEV